MKVLAMYLPQFHRVRENDEWWGEGFTEWTAVKFAEKLFDGHEQPRIPMNEFYYDLMNKTCMQWQADLMHEYEIDGMCFYHYYFKDGRRILEKPVENLFKWKDIDMPFCFSWANESWVRSWSKLSKSNPWFAKFDDLLLEKDNGILLSQDYGDERDWEDHYCYLSPFFHDSRYIKFDGMPVFVFYKPDDIPCLADMLNLWDKLAHKDGFPGIYTIGTNIGEKKGGLKGTNIQEPQDTLSRFYSNRLYSSCNVMRVVDYQDVWDKLIFKQTPNGESLGCFVGYDDTPRRGKEGTVVNKRNPHVFYEGMKRILTKAKKKKSPFVFINAWNEWGEGMYLEPDERYGYEFLEAFRRAKREYLCIENEDEFHDPQKELSVMRMEIKEAERKIDKYLGYWQTFDSWMKMLEQGGTPSDYIKDHGYQNIAIYGYGMFGKHLVNQLIKHGVTVDYAIEKDMIKQSQDIRIYSIDESLPRVDLVIVTVLYDYKEIYEALKKRIKCDILPLDKLFICGCL